MADRRGRMAHCCFTCSFIDCVADWRFLNSRCNRHMRACRRRGCARGLTTREEGAWGDLPSRCGAGRAAGKCNASRHRTAISPGPAGEGGRLMRTLQLYGEVFRRMRRYRARLLAVIMALGFSSIIEAAKPWPLKIVIDNVLRAQPLRLRWLPVLTRHQLLLCSCIVLVLIYLLVGAISVVNNYVTISIGQRMVNDLRAQLFDHLQRLSLSFHRRREIGDLMVRIAYDTMSVQTIAMNGLCQILSAAAMLAAMFYVMVRMDVVLTLAAVAIIPLLLILIASVSSTIDRLSANARIKESRLYTVAHQAL